MRKIRFRNNRGLIFLLSILLTTTIVSLAVAADGTLYIPIIFKGDVSTPPVEEPGVYIPKNSSYYVDSLGYLHVVGEIQNNTEDYLREVYIYVNFYTSQGAWLETAISGTELDNLPPFTGTCFDALLEEPYGWSYYQFQAPEYFTDGSPLPALTVLNDSGSYNPIFDEYVLIGDVRNDQGVRVEYVKPVGTLYNSSNQVVGCDYTYVNIINLDPDEINWFVFYFGDRDYSDVNHYRIQVNGIPQ